MTIIIATPHADLVMNCYPPLPPINGSVSYTTTMEGSQATYKCDNGFIPYEQFKTTCCETGQWFPDPMELVCIKEPCKFTILCKYYINALIDSLISVNCTSPPSIPINGILLNLTSTSATIGCVADDPLNTVTVTCVNQDVWYWNLSDTTTLCSLSTDRGMAFVGKIMPA